MKAAQVTLVGKVTTSTATAVTITPGVDSMDRQAGGVVSTVVINGTGLVGYPVGSPITVRVSG